MKILMFACLRAVLTFNISAAAEPWVQSRSVVLGNPSVATCPTANCPSPPRKPILSTQVIHGITAKGADQGEWLSSLGLFVSTGAMDSHLKISGQKVTQYLGVMQAPGAGTAWALNTDAVRNAIPQGSNSFAGFEGSGRPGMPGAIGDGNGTIGYELDYTNWDSDSSPGQGAFTVGEYVHGQGSFTSLSAIYLDARMGSNKAAWNSGIFFNGPNVVLRSTILDATDAETSITLLGNHKFGFNSTGSNSDMKAIVLRSGQKACFNGGSSCLRYDRGKLEYLSASGKTLFSIDDEGNAVFAGTVVQGNK